MEFRRVLSAADGDLRDFVKEMPLEAISIEEGTYVMSLGGEEESFEV